MGYYIAKVDAMRTAQRFADEMGISWFVYRRRDCNWEITGEPCRGMLDDPAAHQLTRVYPSAGRVDVEREALRDEWRATQLPCRDDGLCIYDCPHRRELAGLLRRDWERVFSPPPVESPRKIRRGGRRR